MEINLLAFQKALRHQYDLYVLSWYHHKLQGVHWFFFLSFFLPRRSKCNTDPSACVFSCKKKICVWTVNILAVFSFLCKLLCIVGIFQVNMKEVNTQKSKLNHCLKPLLALLISLSNNIVVFLKFRMETESNEMDLYPSQIYACLMPSSSWRNTFFFFQPSGFHWHKRECKNRKNTPPFSSLSDVSWVFSEHILKTLQDCVTTLLLCIAFNYSLIF